MYQVAHAACSWLVTLHAADCPARPADGRPSFYTHENAPGVIMAVGNTGEYLEQAADAMCTWLSRDGGATWQDVMPYAGIYECASACALYNLCLKAAKHVRLCPACLPGLGCL